MFMLVNCIKIVFNEKYWEKIFFLRTYLHPLLGNKYKKIDLPTLQVFKNIYLSSIYHLSAEEHAKTEGGGRKASNYHPKLDIYFWLFLLNAIFFPKILCKRSK